MERFQKDFLEPELVACSSYALSQRMKFKLQKVNTETNKEKTGMDSKDEEKYPKRMRTRSANKITPYKVLQQNLNEIRSPPNVAFCFYTTESARIKFLQNVDILLPLKNVTVITAKSSSGIQANIHHAIMDNDDGDSMQIECESDFSCMLGSFPNAHFVPFCASALFDGTNRNSVYIDETTDLGDEFLGMDIVSESLQDAYTKYEQKNRHESTVMEDETSFWKVFVVHVCGLGVQNSDDFLQKLQEKYPHAAIVGGVCDEGDIRLDPNTYEELFRKQFNKLPMYRLKRIIMKEFDKNALYELVEKRDLVNYISSKIMKVTLDEGGFANMTNIKNGVYGLAIGGSVPVRSVVSRGLRSKTSGNVSPSDSQFSVHKVTYVQPEDRNYPYAAATSIMKPVHVIQSVRDNRTGQSISAMEFLLSNLRGAQSQIYLGVRKLPQHDIDDDGFQLHLINQSNILRETEAIVVMTEGGFNNENDVRPNSVIDIFVLDGDACTRDIENNLSRLKEQLYNEKLLGSIMYSCNGRGPQSYLFDEEMMDAKKFAKHFSSLPCLGFYAGGEIGPTATFGNKDVFRKGKVALQGFTAVFAVFVVPDKKPMKYCLDDSPESVQKYMEKRLSH